MANGMQGPDTGKKLLRKAALGEDAINIAPTFKAGDATLARGAEQFRADTASNLAKANQIGQGTAKREAQKTETTILGNIAAREREKETAQIGEQIRQQGRRDVAAGKLADIEGREAEMLQQESQFARGLSQSDKQFASQLGFNQQELASMEDRFQKGLDVTVDQFDRNLTQQEQQFIANMSQQQSQFEQSLTQADDQFRSSLAQNESQFEANLSLAYKNLDMTRDQFAETMGFNRESMEQAQSQFEANLDQEKAVFDWQKEVTQKGIDQQDLSLAYQAAGDNPVAAGIIMKEIYNEAGLEYTEADDAAYKAWIEEEEIKQKEAAQPLYDILDKLAGGDNVADNRVSGGGTTGTTTGGGATGTTTGGGTTGTGGGGEATTTGGGTTTKSFDEITSETNLDRGISNADDLLSLTKEGWADMSDDQLIAAAKATGLKQYKHGENGLTFKDGVPMLLTYDGTNTVAENLFTGTKVKLDKPVITSTKLSTEEQKARKIKAEQRAGGMPDFN